MKTEVSNILLLLENKLLKTIIELKRDGVIGYCWESQKERDH
jgi:hypothetical protein